MYRGWQDRKAAELVKYLGTCSPALRLCFHCRGRKRRASRYRKLLVFPEETEGRRKGGKSKIICKWEWRLNLCVWLRTWVRWFVTPEIILPKDGKWCVLAKKRGSDTIKGFGELGTEHIFCPVPPILLPTVTHIPNHILSTRRLTAGYYWSKDVKTFLFLSTTNFPWVSVPSYWLPQFHTVLSLLCTNCFSLLKDAQMGSHDWLWSYKSPVKSLSFKQSGMILYLHTLHYINHGYRLGFIISNTGGKMTLCPAYSMSNYGWNKTVVYSWSY